jgi:hypothetical protein
MSEQFTHGYALLTGVGACAYPKWSLEVTVRDMVAVQSILTNADLCAYPADANHVRLLHDAGATSSAIMEGLDWLREQAGADPEATVVIYYSGHGWLDEATGRYYLLPHDVEPFDIAGSALQAEAFAEAIRQIPARRLLVLIDSCHAEGMASAKDEPSLKIPSGFAEAAVPKDLAESLKEGEGRAVFTSSRGEQRSWVRPDNSLSIYTYHLIEALQGAGNQPGDKAVHVSNLMNYLGKAVPESARKLCHAEQTPFFDTAAEDFSVAVLRGGKGLPAGGWDAVRTEAEEAIRATYQAILRGSGAIAQDHGVAAGAGGVAVGRDVHGGVHVGGRKEEGK